MTRLALAAGATAMLIALFQHRSTLDTLGPVAVGADDAQAAIADLDAYWAESARTVAEGDFEGYAATYHPDAVLVNESAGTSYPISKALAGWKQGFDDTKSGKMKASVEFRFTRTMRDVTTAHQTGIFHYKSVPADGDISEYYVHFEALLVQRDGWKLLMEYQKHQATLDEWEAAG